MISDNASVLTLDVETTGLNKEVDQVIELACKKGLAAGGELMVWRFKEAPRSRGIWMPCWKALGLMRMRRRGTGGRSRSSTGMPEA